MTLNVVLRFIVLVTAAVAVSACGKTTAKTTVPEKKAIFVSALDCTEHGGLPFEQCDAAVEKAVKIHNTALTQHDSLRACEATEGEGRCERTLDQKFRRAVVAYLVITTDTSTGVPLYAPKGKDMAFRDHSGSVYSESNLKVEFSPNAMSIMEVNAEK